MSASNGDKARFHKQRKKRINARVRMRESRKTPPAEAPKAKPTEK